MPYAAEEYAQMFSRHRAALLDLLAQVPDLAGEIAPWEGGRSIKDLVDHLYSTGEGVVSMLSGGTWEAQPASATLAEAVARLHTNTAVVTEKISGLDEHALQQELTVFGGARWPAYRLIDFHREHEVHHKGQLWLMARQAGIEPPFFTQMS
ncbi:DinB family protein [Deinococcus irradiatisoli]|uniref:DinB family protein n=1 Tax=Deinococcus irradiatisoli TaxID=2202254 RepID=A0A2Z3JNR4_9DEIO|nr:DinB family protein [Deinococcus irradiatisoli]AWN22814.1 DinB family protein [Deinococcus irradiatisoli]